MTNQQLQEIFANMASYIEMMGGKNAFFKARALKNASEIIGKFPHDLSDPEWVNVAKLKKIEGIGQSIAEHIVEYVKTGKVSDYEQMKEESPIKLEELLALQGVGPKKILRLYQELGITDIESLRKAAKENKIASLEGFGEKSQQSILESIDFAIISKDRVPMHIAEQEINQLLNYLKNDKEIINIEAVGSYRRKRETIGDIDLLVSSKSPKKTMDIFVNYPETEKILSHGETKSSIWLRSKIQADIRVIEQEVFGSALQYFTGSKEHNVKLRNIAISKKMKLSEYGLVERDTGKLIESKDEAKIYKILTKNYIEPELRENEGEIDAALNDKLPNLITLKDIKGDLQMHTTNSDGANTIEEMAKKAIELGYEYIGITDHFGKLKIANAIDKSEFDQYLKDIRNADKKIGSELKIYASGEIEIDREGNLEFDRGMLGELDYRICSVHFSTKMSRDDMTNRIIKALKDPLTDILAHPTGRIIGQRPGFEFDHEKVFRAAKEEGVALEINAHPLRLDLSDDLAKMAKDIGCKIVINTDAHSAAEMGYMKHGVNNARRAWIEKDDLYLPK